MLTSNTPVALPWHSYSRALNRAFHTPSKTRPSGSVSVGPSFMRKSNSVTTSFSRFAHSTHRSLSHPSSQRKLKPAPRNLPTSLQPPLQFSSNPTRRVQKIQGEPSAFRANQSRIPPSPSPAEDKMRPNSLAVAISMALASSLPFVTATPVACSEVPRGPHHFHPEYSLTHVGCGKKQAKRDLILKGELPREACCSYGRCLGDVVVAMF